MREVFEKIRARLEDQVDNNRGWEDEPWFAGNTEAYEHAIEIVNQVEEEYIKEDHTDYANTELYSFWLQHQWIPCSERLPDSDRYILMHFANFTLPAIGRYEEDEDGGGAFYIGDEDETCVQQDLFVNAWMELPERYKEEQK